MPTYFKQEHIDEMAERHATIFKRTQSLTLTLVYRRYATELGKEYAQHGVARRIKLLSRCINQIFQRLPPDHEGIPTKDVLDDITIYLQAFVFNVFGTLDNLAFVWVHEKGVRGKKGQPLPNGVIGLARKNEAVWQSFPESIQKHLEEMERWFSYLESFRHSLGHRIPLYVPPYIVDPAKIPDYQALEVRINEAAMRLEVAERERLKAEQTALTAFRPWMKHSFNDPTPPILFHPQILADFATVEEVTQKILGALTE